MAEPGPHDVEAQRGAVGLFYDDMDAFYQAVWGDNLHAGLWSGPQDRAPMVEAQERLTDLFVERVGLGPGQRLLDVGCGTGTPAARAVGRSGCRAVGVTVSRAQVERGAALVRRTELDGRLCFLMSEALALPFADAAFDGAWALESIFHVAERAGALREIARVLRPGGRMVLSDLVERSPLTARERGVTRALQIASLAGPEEYRRLLPGVGLECLEVQDLSDRVRRSIGETIAASERRHGELVRAYGEELYATMLRLLPELEAMYGEKLGYVLVVARRPEA
jgi:cyclopropane fatty-acyl-phospholipid synthase-like methyltransferase